ncbi:thiosulfate sulfurtransferase GlpE [Maricurvus nonylphenolicus]|uniref:thiosulfate sulfurtransferase GlpE n=1 Tax=Maricurvus nonylphenolicus TaxID=1008307 RepID=UPI0036F278A8
MSEFQRISCEQAQQMMAEKTCQVVDIRDEASFANGHVTGSQLLNNINLQDFLLDSDPDAPTLVFCYHGNSSQQAAHFLTERDFTEVYSIDGGFEVWRQLFPQQISTTNG